MISINTEIMRPGFVKQHVLGLGFDAVIHQLDENDPDVIHDHPFSFNSFILNGSYVERVWVKDFIHGGWGYYDETHSAGRSHFVEADKIHQIIAFPQGKCTTLILPREKTNDWGIYEYRNGEMYFKEHGQDNWVLV